MPGWLWVTRNRLLIARIRETRGGRGQSGERIARCQALLDQGLDDADVRMELWFALRQG